MAGAGAGDRAPHQREAPRLCPQRPRAVKEGFRAELDDRAEKIGAKIRDAQLQKIPFMLVCGAREEENSTVSVRSRSQGDLGAQSVSDFLACPRELALSKAPAV